MHSPGTVFLAALLGALCAPGPAQARQAIVRAGADVEVPKKADHVEPLYPEGARASGVEGPVVVGFTIGVDGRVTQPVVLFGHASLELLKFDTEEIPPPSTLHVHRGTLKNVSKEPLQGVIAAAVSRESFNAPQKTIGQKLGDLAPGDERAFELRPEGHQVDIVFGQFVEGGLMPLPARRQVKTMARVLPSRPIEGDRISACLTPSQESDSMLAGTVQPDGGGVSGLTTSPFGRSAPPKALKVTRPQYPRQAFDAGVEGTVLVEILINSSGYIDCARVLRSLPGTGLDEAALVTAYGWRFEPAMKNGRAVPTIAHAPVTFRIY